MKNLLLLATSFLVSYQAQAKDSFLGHGRDRGVLITVTTDKNSYKTGDKIKIQGTIKVSNRIDLDDHSRNQYNGLLEEFKRQGLDIVANYPNEAFDISSSVTFQSLNREEIKFSYETPAVTENLHPQFSVKVYNDQQDKQKLMRLAVLKAKLEKRILLLTNLCNEHRKKHSSQDVLNYLLAEIAKLDRISQKILARLNSEENLMAENTAAFQINNELSAASRLSTVMNRYRFSIEQNPGITIEGQNLKIDAKIVNLRQSDDDFKNDRDDDKNSYKSADFVLNGQYLYTSAPKKMLPGSTITYSYQTALAPSNIYYATFALFDIENGRRKNRYGSLTKSLVVLDDQVAPTWLADSVPGLNKIFVQSLPQLNATVSDSFGRMSVNSIKAKLTGAATQDVTQKLTLTKLGDGEAYTVSGNLNPLAEGDYTLELSAQDFGGHWALPNPYRAEFKIDRTVPVVTVDLQNNILTRLSGLDLPVVITDQSDVSTKIYVNEQLQFTTNQKSFTAHLNLNIEGENKISITSTDAAGNVSTPINKSVFRDTQAPTITSLVPTQNAKLFQYQFSVSGVSNEPLQEARVDDLVLILSADKKSFAGNYVSSTQGPQVLNVKATDLAGNQTIIPLNIDIQTKLLNPALITLFADNDSQHIFIKGQTGAVRSGAEVTATTGFFNLNRDTKTANGDGSFLIRLELFTSVDIKVKDLQTGETDSVSINFTPRTTISGLVQDSDGVPLPGATVKIKGTNSAAITDGQGLFNIATGSTGDQTLLIDGASIPQSATGPYRQFSRTAMVVNIGLGQSNVLSRPIYLTPSYLDGSETTVVAGQPVTVTNSHAPGVSLNLPANIAQFPDGSRSGDITITTINSNRATIAVPAVAIPDTVVALEPSGLTFEERVEVTLPNENDFKPGVRLLIYSMNSAKGIWEIDGEAQVTEAGDQIKTLPGKGISHFSLIYAVPMKPLITEVKDPAQLGVDVSQGSLSTTVELPSFKSLGQSLTPKIVYKSNWAHPTAYVSNLFDIPVYEQAISYSSTKVKEQTKTYKVCYSLFGWTIGFTCDYQDYLLRAQFDTKLDGKSWYVPESIRAQLFVSNLASNQAIVTNVDNSGNTNIETLPGAHFDNSRQSEITTMSGIPSRSIMSFAVPLKNENDGSYLKTGLYPTLARYELRLKHMVLYTQTNSTTISKYRTDNGFEQIEEPSTETTKSTVAESRILDAFAPQDVLSNIEVVNKVDSEVGRGWKFAATQKIVNPESNRILIEEADGSLSTYAMSNTLSTLYDGSSANFDFNSNVDVSRWPSAYLTNKDSQNNSYLNRINVSLTGAVPVNVMQLPVFSGKLASQGYHKCATDTICDSGGCYKHYLPGSFTSDVYNYKTGFQMGGLVVGANGEFFTLDKGQHSLYRQTGNEKLLGVTTLVSELFTDVVTYPRMNVAYAASLSASQADVNTKCEATLGNSCGTGVSQATQFSCDAVNIVRSCPTPVPGKISPFFCNVVRAPQFQFTISQGQVGTTDGDLIALNSPSAMVGLGKWLYIADTGNNRVSKYLVDDGGLFVVAGNGQNYNNGENIPAVNAGLFHPKALAFDAQQNLYIATEDGYIKKVDANGIISSVAGKPVEMGGVLSDEGVATQMAFSNPSGLVFDNTRQALYVADTGNHRVVRIDMNTGFASTIAGTRTCIINQVTENEPATSSNLCSPTSIGLDDKNNLIIVDSGHKRIRRVVFTAASGGSLAYSPSAKDLSTLVRNNDGTWTRKYRSGMVATFNSEGNQTIMQDRVGNTVTFAYDTNGLLTQITDAAGQVSTFEYAGTKLTQYRDPANRVTTFNYSGRLLTSVSLPDGQSKSFGYDQNGLMTEEINQRGKKNQYVYNRFNRLEKVFDANNSQIQVNDFATQSMTNSYVGGSVGQLQGAGVGPAKVHDTVIDAKSNSTEIAKDFNGFISIIKDAAGRTTQINRDTEGKIIKMIRADNSAVEFAYNETTKDLVSSKEVSLDLTEAQTYNSYGQVTTYTNASNQTVTNTYDSSSGLLTKRSNPDGSYLSYAYNSKGLPVSKTATKDSSSLTTQYEYDSLGRVTKITDQAGKSVRYTYDAAGNVLQAIASTNGSDQITTTYTYDEFNRIKTVTSPLNEVTTYNYLPTGELSQIIDPKGKITQFDYDNRGQLIKKTDPNGKVNQLAYDASGNLQSETDPAGQVKQYSYNALNKLSQVQTADDLITYSYNLRDEVVQVSNAAAVITYERDQKQRITHESVVGQNISYPQHDLFIDYNGLDQRISLVSNFQNIAYAYSANQNQLIAINSTTTGNYGFSYDSLSRLTQIARPGSVTNYTYDAGSNLAKISHQKSGLEIGFHEYTYDARNFITQKRSPSNTQSYNYDSNGQLISSSKAEDVTQNETFTYDALGNRLTYNGQSSSYDNSGQQIQEDGLFTYVYDNNGNIIYKSNKSNGTSYAFEYSALNQLKKVTVTSTPLGGAVLKTIYYKYDPLGRRISRHVIDNADASQTNLRKFYYDGPNIIAEVDAGNNLTASYTHSPLQSDDILGARFTTYATPSGALSPGQVIASGVGNVYYLKDHLNTVNELTNASGVVIQRFEYSAFGKLAKVRDANNVEVSFGSAPVRTSFTYTGREYEPELNMYYYRARYYDPTTGRFLQIDPDPGKLSRPNTFLSKYIYAGSNPVMFKDPSGRIFGIDDLIIWAALTLVIGSIDNNINGGNYFNSLIKGAVIATILYATWYVTPELSLGFAKGTAGQVLNYGINIGGIALTSGSQSGNAFNNFARNVMNGDSIFAAGFQWIGYAFKADTINGVGRYGAYAISATANFMAYLPLIESYCHPKESNGEYVETSDGTRVNRCE